MGLTWVWLRSRPGWAATPWSQQTHITERLLVALSRGHYPHFLLCDSSPLLIPSPSMLQGRPLQAWLLVIIWGPWMGWPQAGPGQRLTQFGLSFSECPCLCLFLSPSLCILSLRLSVSLSLPPSTSVCLCLSFGQALLCNLRQTSFPLRASVSPSG